MRVALFAKVVGLGAVLALSLGASNCNNKSEIELVILHTNDVHSRFDAGSPGSDDNIFRLGGLARLKTLIDQQRAKHANTLLLDGGDWSEGGIFYTVDAGQNVLRLMDYIGYNAIVMGNHDFLNGPSEVANRVQAVKPKLKVLAANIDVSALPPAEAKRIKQYVPDYAVFKVGGVRVAVIGVTTVATEYQSFFEPGKIKDYQQATAAVSKKIHDQKLADVILVLSHNHMKDNLKIAKNVPYISMVVSGHDHAVTVKPRQETNAGAPVYVVEAGEWGKFLGKMTFVIDTKRRSMKMRNYELIPVQESIPQHATLKSMITTEMHKVITRFGYDVFNDHVGDCEEEMPINRQAPTALATILAESYRDLTNADIGVEQSDLIGTGIPEGPLTTRVLFDVVPYIFGPKAERPFPREGRSWTVQKLTLTGGELFNLITLAGAAPNLGLPLGWIAMSGIKITYRAGDRWNPIDRIQVLDRNTGAYVDFNFDNTYTLALTEGVLRALNILSFSISKIENTNVTSWQALHRLISARGTVSPREFDPEHVYVPTEGDLGLLRHNVRFEPANRGYSISVKLTNTGLKATAPMALRVLRQNRPDDPLHALESSAYVPVNKSLSVPALNPGQSTELTMAWTQNVVSGATPFRFYLDGKDAVSRNNSLSVNYRIP